MMRQGVACALLPRALRFAKAMMQRLFIIVVEKDRDRAMLIVDGLRDAGDFDEMVIAEETGLARRIAQRNPDLVLIDAGNPSRNVLDELALATAPTERPVAMFVDPGDGSLTKAGIEAGMSACVADGLRAFTCCKRCGSRFRKPVAHGRAQGDRPRQGHPDARGGIGEEDADALLRKTAMDQGRKLAEVAQALVMTADLLK
jgi:response regulator NasT